MHMSDALISATVGGVMMTATVGTIAYSTKKIKFEDDSKIPMMGVMGAFVFAAQMLNFSIPGTGSSGHLGGGLILAALLGPEAGFLTMSAVLLIQALFFGDGGLLAYGCNVFNLGFYTCFLAYPLIFKKILRKNITGKRIFGASLVSAIIGLQLGAFSVVLETLFSGKTELPFSAFLLLMQPIHMGIGIVEGLATAAVLSFVWKARPEILDFCEKKEKTIGFSPKKILVIFSIIALLFGGVFSWFASSDPDGLEWSMAKVTGEQELTGGGKVHDYLAELQKKTAFLPDYGFKKTGESEAPASAEKAAWPAADSGTSTAGILGGAMTLGLVAVFAAIVSTVKKQKKSAEIVDESVI